MTRRTPSFLRLAVSSFAATLLGAIAIGTLAAEAAVADWPTYLRDYRRTGSSPDALDLPLGRAWTYVPPAPPHKAWADPGGRVLEGKAIRDRVRYDDSFHVAVVADRIYFGASDHQLHCRDAHTGDVLWTFFTGGPIRLAPTVADGKVYFGSDDGFAYCLDAATGSLVWRRHVSPSDEWLIARGAMISRWPVRTSVLVDGGIAYFGAGVFPHETVYLCAVDARTGETLWVRDDISQMDAGRDDLSPQGHLLLEGERLFVPSGRVLPAAFDRNNGSLLFKGRAAWRTTAGGVVGGTEALLVDGQIIASGAHHLLAMDQKSGQLGYGWFDGYQMTVQGDAAFVLTGKAAARLDRARYAEASRVRQEKSLEAYALNRKLSGASQDAAAEYRARIRQLNKQIEAGRDIGVVWQTPTAAESALIVTGGLLIAGGDGEVLAFNVQSGEKVWQADVDGEARGLAVAAGNLYVSTTSGKIVCFRPGEVDTEVTHAPAEVDDPYGRDELTALYRAAAEEILGSTGVRRGYCLVVGAEQGRLACELAKASELKVYCVEPDEAKVAAARAALSKAGLYGHRVTVHHADPGAIPYSNYFANLIVSDAHLLTGRFPADPRKIARHLKPVGGVVCLTRPEGAPGPAVSLDALRATLAAMDLGECGAIRAEGNSALLTRGALPGAGSWSHQYGDPGNTACSDDRRVRGDLGVLWYGDPGEDKMVNRHDGAVAPVAANGRLFVQGEDSLLAYDAYNGELLWERENPEAIRVGVYMNRAPGNLAAGDGSVFMMMRDKCYEYDAATGAVKAAHELPESTREAGTHQWGFVAYADGILYGTATILKPLDEALRRRGRKPDDVTDVLFAIDAKSGRHLWEHQGQNIAHHTIAIGPRRVFYIDSTLSKEQRDAMLREDKSELARLTGSEREQAEARLKRLDARTAVAIDSRSGEKMWSQPVDVTDCSDVGIGGGALTLMYRDGVLVLGGANANGHYWQQFVAGEFKRRRLVALSAADGYKLWARDANYKGRPIIVGGQVIAEPWSYDLHTGQQRTQPHPVTGREVPWSIMRTGHHCGIVSAAPHMLLFRSGDTGFYDLVEDGGTRHFAGHRPGCWINSIAANGLVMIPEASSGCVCLFSILTTVVLEPREARNPWAIYSSVGPTTPVASLKLNLGAPGDRRDARGNLWLTNLRPKPYRENSLDIQLDVATTFLEGGEFACLNSQSHRVAATEAEWLYTSWARGLSKCEIPLLGQKDSPANYTVRLHFADLEPREPGRRVFDVKLQGETVLADFDIVAANGPNTAVVREFAAIRVEDALSIELVCKNAGSDRAEMPILSAIEIERDEPAREVRAGDEQ